MREKNANRVVGLWVPLCRALVTAAGGLPLHEALGAVAGHAHQQARDSSDQSFHFHLLDCIVVQPARTDTPFIGLFPPTRQFPLAMADISVMNKLFKTLTSAP